ncbi:MAG: hypothetical protein ACI81W_003549, partial [Saprospiraceae bacterium]
MHKNPISNRNFILNRRAFLSKTSIGLGAAALSSLLGVGCFNKNESGGLSLNPSDIKIPHFAPKAKRVIYLFQSGGPSQLDLFDYKPLLEKMRGQDLPESIRKGQRLTGMTSGQKNFPLAN